MKIAIIGGGPAGLYFALLMKKRFASHDITVYERNGPNDTFGWGVVFSDKTLSFLRQHDEESYNEIFARFTAWENVDVVHRDEKISIKGNKFSGIARIEMLNILQRRCAALGVNLRFNAEIADPEPLRACDLVIGADGVNSAVRSRYADFFQPSLGLRTNKYIWYGTRRLFHALTLTFRQTPHGAFAAHSYKFNATTSTFIIECPETTWRAAGLDAMEEPQSRAYLERVFAKDLDGNALLSNNSKWINFLLVKNARWHYKNVVLLGDALHTAHFSIGSGTKLALEDSIALFHAFEGGAAAPAALADFEQARKPIVDEYQEAAMESLLMFENMEEYMRLDPLRFAYKLMTRSGRVDRENLRRRDPAFMAAYEALGE